MDNDTLDSIFEDQETVGETGDQGTVGASHQEIEPVKLGRLATTGIIATGIIILMILIVTLKSCSIEKKNSDSDGSNISENYVNSEEIHSDMVSKSVESSYPENNLSSSALDAGLNTKNSSNYDDSSNFPVESSLGVASELNPEVLSDVVESRGMVISKHCYEFQGSYIYDIEISVLMGDEAKTAHYFCPKKTFDALKSTDSVNVMYQFDSSGRLSIYSISTG